MNKETLIALEQALEASPNNHLLRKQVGFGFMGIGEFDKAKTHLNLLLQEQPSNEIKQALAKCYLKLGNFSVGLIICDELIGNQQANPDLIETYIRLLYEDGQLEEAIARYQYYQVALSGWENPDLEQLLKVPAFETKEEGGSIFMEKPDIDFSKVGGMDDIKEDIRIKIIQPLQNPELFKAFGKKAGGGILLYGPPGCGKTYLARATAGEISSKFISIGINEVMDMWLGNSEKNLHEKFEIARKNQPTVLFFDEIDALGSKRNDLRQSAGRNVINQFLKELDGVDVNNDGLLILGATNSPWHIDSAFLRPGRFDRIIFVPPPDEVARQKILELMLVDKPIESIDYKKVASKAIDFSGADIQLLVETAVEEKLRQSMKSGKIEKITTKDLLQATKRIRPSTKEWFNTARNYALYANQSGLYDEIKDYLKL